MNISSPRISRVEKLTQIKGEYIRQLNAIGASIDKAQLGGYAPGRYSNTATNETQAFDRLGYTNQHLPIHNSPGETVGRLMDRAIEAAKHLTEKNSKKLFSQQEIIDCLQPVINTIEGKIQSLQGDLAILLPSAYWYKNNDSQEWQLTLEHIDKTIIPALSTVNAEANTLLKRMEKVVLDNRHLANIREKNGQRSR